MARVHPIWGRPFEQYIDSFNVEATKPRITWRHDFELEAARLEAADVTRKLYELAGEWEKVDTRKLDGYITLPMLKSLDKLSYSPITLVDFGHTAHISGCIKLLWAASKSVKQPGRSTIFSYEYGYLCFRIIITTIGVCILQRLDQFSETLREMLSDPSADLAATLSRRVSELIEEEVQASTHERYFDRILGWAKFKDHPAQEPFALRSDMWMLLNLLYDDRKRFLSVCTSTYSLGLSGLMFLLWRYHRFDCLVNSTDTHASKEFIPLFGDVLWRYFLIAPTSQFTPLTIIYEQMGALAKIGRATFIDLEDSKAIINTYIMRLAPSDPRFYEPLSVTAMPVFLFQTIQFLKPGCEHLLPLFFRNSIQRLWSALLDDEVEVSILLESIKDEFQFLEDYLEFLGKCSKPGQVALYQIVDEMIENDFVEFALRVSLMLDIENYDTSNERATSNEYITYSSKFFYTLGQVVPHGFLQDSFGYLAPGLARYASYLRWLSASRGLTNREMPFLDFSKKTISRSSNDLPVLVVIRGAPSQAALGMHVEYARVRSIAVLDVKQRIGGARTHKIRTKDYVLDDDNLGRHEQHPGGYTDTTGARTGTHTTGVHTGTHTGTGAGDTSGTGTHNTHNPLTGDGVTNTHNPMISGKAGPHPDKGNLGHREQQPAGHTDTAGAHTGAHTGVGAAGVISGANTHNTHNPLTGDGVTNTHNPLTGDKTGPHPPPGTDPATGRTNDGNLGQNEQQPAGHTGTAGTGRRHDQAIHDKTRGGQTTAAGGTTGTGPQPTSTKASGGGTKGAVGRMEATLGAMINNSEMYAKGVQKQDEAQAAKLAKQQAEHGGTDVRH